MAAIAVAVFASFTPRAEAQISWPRERVDGDRTFSISRKSDRALQRRRPAKIGAPVKETSKPVGPIVIAISIEKQQLKLYDGNGLFAESPVSTGVRGHPTPLGVFSIIQKNKFHRSNIYSGAPMPFMQRITWSGVAMHAGVLPGYPASHGCIRMPANFATRMWGWTRMGARVIIAPGELSPSDLSHPRLFAKKPEPVAMAAAPAAAKDDTANSSTVKSDKAGSSTKAADASGAIPRDDAKAELRATLPENNKNVQTADASGTVTPSADAETKTDKDQARAENGDQKPGPPAKPEAVAAPIKRTGHIAAYVSRKDGKLYVRQNFEPLFDTPVTITGERPLGTHVFTVRASKDAADALLWSAVSLPMPVRAEKPQSAQRKRITDTPVTPQLPPSTSSEALDRVNLPDDAMQKIAAAIAPGGSIVISDQGLGDETGLGTDFIVQLR